MLTCEPLGQQLLLGAVDGDRSSEGKPCLSCRLGLEVEDADNARAIDTRYTGRASRIDGNGAGSVLEVDERNGLVVAAEQISIRHTEERQFCGVILNPQGNRGDVLSPRQHYRDLEGGSCSHRATWRTEHGDSRFPV